MTNNNFQPLGGKQTSNIKKAVFVFCGILLLLVLQLLMSILGYYIYDNYVKNNIDSTNKNKKSGSFGNLIFDENFDTLNLTRWQHVISAFGGGNWEFEYYSNNRTNSYVRDGILYIKPTLTNNTYTDTNYILSGTLDLWGSVPADVCTGNFDYGCSRTGSATNALNPVQSARLRTVNSFSFKYGRIELSAKLPKGDWLWPAIWMIPKHNGYGKWPASGEIDIVEARSNYNLDCSTVNPLPEDGAKIGAKQFGSTLHWGPYYGADLYNYTHKNYSLSNNQLFSDSFHNFTVEWTPNGFTFYLDGNQYFNVNSTKFGGYWKLGKFDKVFPNSFNPWNSTGNQSMDAPFDKEFFFVVNVAVGGTNGFFPDGCISMPDNNLASYAKPWIDDSTTAYTDFWNSVDSWYPTWNPFGNNGEDAALKIDYIRVYEYSS